MAVLRVCVHGHVNSGSACEVLAVCVCVCVCVYTGMEGTGRASQYALCVYAFGRSECLYVHVVATVCASRTG